MFFVVVKNSDNLVYGKQTGPDKPPDTAERTYVELTAAEYAALGSLTLEQGGGPAYMLDNGSIVPRPDARFRVRMTLNTANPTDGNFVNMTFELLNADGSPNAATGTRAIGVRIDSETRQVRLSLTNGAATVNKRLPRSGEYSFYTVEPDFYKIEGDTRFSVLEDW